MWVLVPAEYCSVVNVIAVVYNVQSVAPRSALSLYSRLRVIEVYVA